MIRERHWSSQKYRCQVLNHAVYRRFLGFFFVVPLARSLPIILEQMPKISHIMLREGTKQTRKTGQHHWLNPFPKVHLAKDAPAPICPGGWEQKKIVCF